MFNYTYHTNDSKIKLPLTNPISEESTPSMNEGPRISRILNSNLLKGVSKGGPPPVPFWSSRILPPFFLIMYLISVQDYN